MSGTCSGTPAPMTRTAPASAAAEVVNHKSMVPEPEWFNGDRKMFKDWWRAMKLYLRANKVTDTNKKNNCNTRQIPRRNYKSICSTET